MPVLSKGRGRKNIWVKKITEKYAENNSNYKKISFGYLKYVLDILLEHSVYKWEPFYKYFLLFFFENTKFALRIWWGDLMFGAKVIKILLDPDHLGLKDGKSTKIR